MLNLPPLEQLELVPAQTAGGPLMVPIDDVDEDPDQPRLEFDDEPLKGLRRRLPSGECVPQCQCARIRRTRGDGY